MEDSVEILNILARFPEGASIKEIQSSLESSITQRTLQRRLSDLVGRGEVVIRGKSRARRYYLSAAIQKEESVNHPLKLSQEGIEINERVSQPIQMRRYVNYNRDFLDNYRPNESAYLSDSSRAYLTRIGSRNGTRPAGTYARQILNRLLIDLSWNSSRLEGNTYSLLETERLIQLSEEPEGKNLQETQMILNHKAAIEFLVESVNEIGMNRFTILNLHALLSNNLLGNPEACGRLREIPVGIAKSVYQPTAILPLVEECFELILSKAVKIHDPFEQAFFLMVQLPYLQPFEDVNKRVSRLGANIPLFAANLCPFSFVDVPQDLYINALLGVYELNQIDLMRDLFLWAYERSCALYSTTRQALGEPDPFRLKYREQLFFLVGEIVIKNLGKQEAVGAIREFTHDSIPEDDRTVFIETVETELRGLHEGNIARYRLRPTEYNQWKSRWDG